MTAIVPAPLLCQGADENLLLELGSVFFPGFVARHPDGNGLRLVMDGDYADDAPLASAANRFQTLLGLLRAWRPIAGQRVDEVRPGIGPGSIRNERGDQLVKLGTVVGYLHAGTEFIAFARQAHAALNRSANLSNAVWLNGRRDRNSADFYMIYEYAEREFRGRKSIVESLGVSDNDIARLRSSTNNLGPADGGRHALGSGNAEWNIAEQMEFIACFIRRWIAFSADSSSTST